MKTLSNASAAGSLNTIVNDATKLLPRKIARLKKVENRTPQQDAALWALIERETAFRLLKTRMQQA
jgi:hypothetical protein